MKKYIRTKDTDFRTGEILKVLHEDEKYFECEGTFEKRINCKAYVKKEIVVKSADSIEELCDEFVRYVAVDDFHNILRDYEFKDLKLIGERIRKTDDKVYGAIWTDKGLIYVAKMNEKGELELL